VIRAESRAGSAPVSPLRAMAWGADGTSYVTPPIVSPGLYTIRSRDGVFQTPSKSTISIRLDVIPSPTPTVLTVRIDGGKHGTTNGAHPADGDSWPVAAGADPYTFELIGSTWVAGSIFGFGHCYVSKAALIEASGPLNDMFVWGNQHSPAIYQLPLGGMYCQKGPIFFPASGKVSGAGGNRTFFVRADWADIDPAFPWYNVFCSGYSISGNPPAAAYGNVSQLHIEGFTAYGNRAHQVYGLGMHLMKLGSDTDAGVPINVTGRDIHMVGSSGYGSQLGGHNAKAYVRFRDSTWQWSDGDNFDCKNRLNENDDVEFLNCTWGWHALGDQGTNLKPLIAIPNNGITTVAATTTCTVSRNGVDKNTRAGDVITIAGASSFDGVNPNGSWHVTATSSGSNTITFDTGQTPSVGGVSGGGSSATAFIPHISVGDCHVDCRGKHFLIDGGYAEAEYWTRTGFRQRGGDGTNTNGEGGTGIMVRNVRGVDRTPSWIPGSTDNDSRAFVSLLGKHASISGVYFESAGSTVGIYTAPGSQYVRVSDFGIIGAYEGVQCRGNYGQFSNGRILNSTRKAVEVYGLVLAESDDLGDDPLQPQGLGSGTLIVTQVAHGKAVGMSFNFSGIVNENNGINIGGTSTNYTIASVIGADHFTFAAGGSATSTNAFGGGSANINYGTNPNIAIGNWFTNVISRQENTNTATGWSIGRSDGATDGRAQDTRIFGCADYGSNLHYEDAGSSTDWAGLNKNLPNNGVFDALTASGLVTAGYMLAGSGNTATGLYDFSVDGASSGVEFHGLSAYSQIALVPIGLTHGSASTQNWQAQVSQDNSTWKTSNGDYARSGVSAGTSGLIFCGSIAQATPASGVVEIFLFNSALKHPVRINGGGDNSSSGAQSQGGYVTAAAALQAVRVINGGGVATTGGVVYCLGKV